MNTALQPTNPANFYFGFLKNLNADSKLDLIAMLSESLKQANKRDASSVQSLFGAFQSAETADELIAAIRAARVSNRNRETL